MCLGDFLDNVLGIDPPPPPATPVETPPLPSVSDDAANAGESARRNAAKLARQRGRESAIIIPTGASQSTGVNLG